MLHMLHAVRPALHRWQLSTFAVHCGVLVDVLLVVTVDVVMVVVVVANVRVDVLRVETGAVDTPAVVTEPTVDVPVCWHVSAYPSQQSSHSTQSSPQ